MRLRAASSFVRQQRDLWLGLAVVAVISFVTFGPTAGLEAQTQGSTPAGLYPRLTCVAPDPDNANFFLATFGYENSTPTNQTVAPDLANNYIVWFDPFTGAQSAPSNSVSTFAVGLYPSQFQVRFEQQQAVTWFLTDPSVPTQRSVIVNAGSGPACVGIPGPQGPPGADGLDGAQGPSGPAGSTGATGPTGPAGPQGAPGAGMMWRGTFNSATSYADADAVQYNGSTYRLVSGNGSVSGVIPPTAPWELVAAAGSPGANGANGAVGPTGPAGPLGPQGLQGAQGIPGTGMTWRGLFNASTSYVVADAVQFNGSSYRMTSANGSVAGVFPPAAPWELFAAAGAAGAAGATGSQGPQGPAGVQGAPGPQGPIGPAGTGANFGARIVGSTSQLSGNSTALIVARPALFDTITLTLPPASTLPGQSMTVRLDALGRVLLQAPAGQSLVAARLTNGVLLENRFDAVTVGSDGSAWYVVSDAPTPVDARAPSLEVRPSVTSVAQGQTLTFTAVASPGTPASAVDAYAVLTDPSGIRRSLTFGGLATGIETLVANFPLTAPANLQFLSLQIPVGAPIGVYSVQAVLTAPGTLTPLSPVKRMTFAVRPGNSSALLVQP